MVSEDVLGCQENEEVRLGSGISWQAEREEAGREDSTRSRLVIFIRYLFGFQSGEVELALEAKKEKGGKLSRVETFAAPSF